MAAAIPLVIAALSAGGQMVEANQQSQDQKGQNAAMNKSLAAQQALANSPPPASAAPPPGTPAAPTNPGAAGRKGTILTGPMTPPLASAGTAGRTLLGL